MHSFVDSKTADGQAMFRNQLSNLGEKNNHESFLNQIRNEGINLEDGDDEERDQQMYDDGEEFAKQIKATIIAGNPIIQNYLEGVSVQSDDSALDNILNLLEQETKKWKANQYYWKQVKEEDS